MRAVPPPLSFLGLATAGGAVLLGPALQAGGVAVLVGAAAVATLVAAPLAAIEGHTPGTPGRWERAAGTLLPAAIGAALAHACRAWTMAPALALLGAGGLAGLTVLHRRDRRVGAAVLGATAVGMLVAAWVAPSGAAIRTWAPWTLLVPTWADLGTWGPPAAVLGLLLPATGAWHAGPSTRGAWHTAAAGLALLVAGASAAGVAYERGAHLVTGVQVDALPAVLGVGLLLMLPAAGTLARGTRAHPTPSRGELALWTLWFTLAGAPASRWVWTTLVPLALLPAMLRIAQGHGGLVRVRAGVAGVLAVLAAVAGFPGIPQDATGSVLAAASVVAMVWRAGWSDLRTEAT